ncbi:hypothetical protein J4E91_011090 [Alternaria rosae]|nr:hypothetical protein J4E91_011090 [Alternaria rosae]
MICKLTVSTPSTPQSSVADGEGDGVDEEEETVSVVGVVAITEESLEEVRIEDDVRESMDDDELDMVLVIVSLVDVESRVELEDEALMEVEVEVEYALELPQYEYWEQQLPYLPPEQVIPAGEAPYEFPQRALVVTLTFAGVAEGAVDGAVRIEVEVLLRLDAVEVRAGATALLQVPNGDWQPVPQ